MKTLILEKIGKSLTKPRSVRAGFALGRHWMAPGGIAALMALASVGPSNSAIAGDPALGDVPSYILNPPASIAALIQNDQTPAPETDSEKTLRSALEILDDSNASKDQAASDVGSDTSTDFKVDPSDPVANRSIFADRRTSLKDGRFVLPQIEALTTGTEAIGNGEVPLGFREGEVSPMIVLPESGTDRGLPWQWSSYQWAAANTFSHPLYFEDRMLERHGHQRHPYFQPLVSGGRFAAQAFMLPYLSAISPPCECEYSLGYYRAGSCVPAFKQRPPYQRKAAAAQATAIGTGIAILP